MSYVLGTHSSSHSGLGFIDVASVQNLGSGDKTTALNIFMFGPDQGKSPEERSRRFRALDLTAPYLTAFDVAQLVTFVDGKSLAGIRRASLTLKQKAAVRDNVTKAFNQAHALAFPPASGEVLDTAGAGDDNTLLYVAGAAGVALLAFGLMRRGK